MRQLVNKYTWSGEVAIPPEDWNVLQTKTPEIWKPLLYECVSSLFLPTRTLERDKAKSDFLQLKGVKCNVPAMEWEAEYYYTLPFSKAYIEYNDAGYDAVDYWMEDRRWETRYRRQPSASTVLRRSQYAFPAFDKLRQLPMVESKALRYCVADFLPPYIPPAAIKTVIDLLKPKEILAMHAGFAESMVAAFAAESVEAYEGNELQTLFFHRYKDMVPALAHWAEKQPNGSMNNQLLAEDRKGVNFDLVWWQPYPYDMIDHGLNIGQPFEKCANMYGFFEEYLYPAVKSICSNVRHKKYIAIQAADFTDPSTGARVQWVNKLNKHLEEMGLTLKMCLGIEMSPNGPKTPLWIWQETHYIPF